LLRCEEQSFPWQLGGFADMLKSFSIDNFLDAWAIELLLNVGAAEHILAELLMDDCARTFEVRVMSADCYV
jgi:hypothetical protein